MVHNVTIIFNYYNSYFIFILHTHPPSKGSALIFERLVEVNLLEHLPGVVVSPLGDPTVW